MRTSIFDTEAKWKNEDILNLEEKYGLLTDELRRTAHKVMCESDYSKYRLLKYYYSYWDEISGNTNAMLPVYTITCTITGERVTGTIPDIAKAVGLTKIEVNDIVTSEKNEIKGWTFYR